MTTCRRKENVRRTGYFKIIGRSELSTDPDTVPRLVKVVVRSARAQAQILHEGALGRPYSRAMGSIRADVDGLFTVGAVCQQEAESLSVGHRELHSGPAYQATTGAVEGVFAMAGRAENLISLRLRTTGHIIVKSAMHLASCDDTSRERVSTVAIGATAI